jgi:hypothetical protein
MKDLFKSIRTPVFSVEQIRFKPQKQLFKLFYSKESLTNFVLDFLRNIKISKITRFLLELINHKEINFSNFGVVHERLEAKVYLLRIHQNFKTEYV